MNTKVLVVDSVLKQAWNDEKIVAKNDDVTLILHIHNQEYQGQVEVGEEMPGVIRVESPSVDNTEALKEKDHTIEALTNQVSNYEKELGAKSQALSELEVKFRFLQEEHQALKAQESLSQQH